MYDIFAKLLELHNVTIADVCRATGISQSVISNWKKRKNQLSAKNLQLVADYFGVSVKYMLTGETDKEKESGYYFNESAAEYAQFVFENPEYKVLFDASRKVKAQDIKKALKAIGIFIEDE